MTIPLSWDSWSLANASQPLIWVLCLFILVVSTSMAGLRDTLQKLVPDKLKNMKRQHDESEPEQHPKQPRTLPGSSTSKGKQSYTGGLPPSHLPVPKHPSSMDYTWGTRNSQRSTRHSEGSTNNPVDLSNSSSSTPASRSSGFSNLSKLGSDTSSDLWLYSDSKGDDQQRQAQVVADEHLAQQLQAELNADVNEGGSSDNRHLSLGATPWGAFKPSQQPPSDEEAAHELHEYGLSLKKSKCPHCPRTRTRMMQGAEVVSRTRKMLKDGFLHPCLKCDSRKCGAFCCVGCGRTYENQQMLTSYKSGKGFKVAWCCDRGRQYLTWCLAGGLEFKELGSVSPPMKARLRSANKAKTDTSEDADAPGSPTGSPTGNLPPAASSSKSKKPKADSGVAKGTGYGGTNQHHHHGLLDEYRGGRKAATPKKPTWEPTMEERAFWQYLRALALVLPTVNSFSSDYEQASHGRLLLFLVRSPILRQAAELLLGGSTQEISEKEEPFEVAVSFVEAICNHPDVVPCIYRELVLYPDDEQLLRVSLYPPAPLTNSLDSAADEPSRASEFPSAQPLRKTIDTLARHLRTYIKLNGAEESTSMDLFRRITKISDFLTENAPALADKPSKESKGKEAATEAATRLAKYQEWSQVHKVEEVPEDKLLECFYFKDRAERLSKEGGANKRRMTKLCQQFSDLANALPDGIFVRYTPTLLGAMKVLIVGPTGTPYEHGLFEFDLFCDAKFPDKPPEMQFRTTGAGKVGFNPNLYNTGKICLSLLGTWAGQPWDPNGSTLWQVLVSIQGMILTAEPWYNEPGRESTRNNTASKTYNQQIQQYTVQYALNYWLTDRLKPPEPTSPRLTTNQEPPTTPTSKAVAKPSTPTSSSTKAKGTSMLKTLADVASSSPLSPFTAPSPSKFLSDLPPQPPVLKTSSSLMASLGLSAPAGFKSKSEDGPGGPGSTSGSASGSASGSGSGSGLGYGSASASAFASWAASKPYLVSSSGSKIPMPTASPVGPPQTALPPGLQSLFGGLNATSQQSPATAPAPASSGASGAPGASPAEPSTPPTQSASTQTQPPSGPGGLNISAIHTILQNHSAQNMHLINQFLNTHGSGDMMTDDIADFLASASELGSPGGPLGPLDEDDYHYVGMGRRVPEGNTSRDGNDDYVWGEVVRQHFSARGRDIAKTVERWKGRSGSGSAIGTSWRALKGSMIAHGFLEKGS